MKTNTVAILPLQKNKNDIVSILRPKQTTLSSILWIVFIVTMVSGTIMYFSKMDSYWSVYLMGGISLLGVLLNRAGHQTISSILLIAGLSLAVQYNIFQGYGIHDVAIIAWPALIFFAGLLFGSRVIPYSTAVIIFLAVLTKIIPNAKNFTGSADTGDLIVMLLILVAFNFVGMSILRSNEISVQHLLLSDERFQTIYHSINDGIVIHDAQTGAILDVNDKMLEMFGYTRSEALMIDLFAISSGISPYTQEEALNWLGKAVTQGAQYFEWQAKDKSGRLFWVDINMKQAVIGNEPRVLVSVRDITKRKQAEEAHRESEVRFQDMADLLPQVVFEYDLQGKLMYANQYALDLFGYERIVPCINVFDYLDESQHIRALNTIQMLIDGHDDINHEYNVKHKDGSLFPALIYMSVIRKENQACGLRGVVIDISEIKRSELALQESEERYRNLYENSTVGLYRTTPDGRITLANPALIEMLGFSSFEEFSSRNLEEEGYAPGYERAHFVEMIEQTGEVKGLESAWTRKDGSVIFVSESAGETRDEQGKVLYYDGTVEDISARKKAENMLRESESRFRAFVEQAPVAIGVFNLNGNGMYANRKFIEILGLESFEDMVGRPAFEYFAPQFRE
ncbi:MAG: PAS domain S-box protein, partial [Chloroflexota bacterium]